MALLERIRARLARGLRVSVVVPVFNPGELVDALIASLDRQSLARRRFEAIFVDDGSTDDSLGRLRFAASTRRYMSVVTIPNSGWPGRPRNVGIDKARGTYVFFADQDDELFPRALERMCDMADRNSSDIVYGKLVRSGAPTPYWTWGRGDIDRADLLTDPVLSSRTVHKLFRRSFVADNDLRFLEGRVRLEDHHFMGQAFACDPVLSVLASYPCYRWIDRKDGTNTSSEPIDFGTYLGHWAGALDVLEARGASQDLRRAVAVTAFGQLLGKPAVSGFAGHDPERQAEEFAQLSAVSRRLFPAEIDERLPVLKRWRLQALRADDQETFRRLQTFKGTVRRTVEVVGVRPERASFGVDARAKLVLPEGDARLIDGVLDIPGIDDRYDRRLLDADRPRIEITVRHGAIGTEWHVDSAGGEVDQASCSGVIDPVSAAFGKPLGTGTWHVLIRASLLGETTAQWAPLGMGLPDMSLPIERITDARTFTAVGTKQGTLAIKVARRAARP